MRVERQNAFPSTQLDVFSAVDFFFPRGLDHHHLFAGVPVAEAVMARVARQLAGLGKLPDNARAIAPSPEIWRTQIAVVGAGASGQAAARALAERNVDFLLIEREHALGMGSRWVEEPGEPAAVLHARLDSTAIGIYGDAEGQFILVRRPKRLAKLYARRFVLAPGGHATHVAFEDNDLPGVYSHSAALRLLRHGLLVGERPSLVGARETLRALEAALRGAGAELAVLLDTGAGDTPVRALGDGGVRGLEYRKAGGDLAKVVCDAIVLCVPPAPSFELAKQAGAEVHYVPEAGGFCVRADAQGRTSLSDLFVAGTLAGVASREASRVSGERAGAAAAEGLS
jgi:sarcosine oxidase subunit alpha